MFHIAVKNVITSDALHILPGYRYAFNDGDVMSHAILLRSFQLSADEVGRTVEAIARAGTGVNNIPVQAMSERGIPVFNAPGANANAVAEYTIMTVLMAARNMPDVFGYMQGITEPGITAETIESQKGRFQGHEIGSNFLGMRGSIIGIIGLGAIGKLVAEKAVALGMTVLGYDTEMTHERAQKLPVEMRLVKSLVEAVRVSSFVTLHVPLIEGEGGTREYFDDRYIMQMDPETTLINFARGEIVHELSILQGFGQDRFKYYITDFLPQNEELRARDDVVVLPHLGGSTEQAQDVAIRSVLLQLQDYLEHGNIENAVNFPNVSKVHTSKYRLTVAHRNVPGAMAAITAILAEAGYNVDDSVLLHRGNLGYVIFDVNMAMGDNVLHPLNGLDAVLRARYIEVENA